jgi:hypothetical protein
MVEIKRKSEFSLFVKSVSEIIQASIIFGFLYGYIADVVDHARVILGGSATDHMSQSVQRGIGVKICSAVLQEGSDIFRIPCGLLIVCVVTAVILYYILEWVCNQRWVQEETSFKECWEEIVWWNPWSWVKTLVCVVKEVTRWVLKVVCYARKIIIWGTALVCVGLALYAAVT